MFVGRSWLPATGPIDYVADDRGPVRIVALDVTLPGLHHGVVSAEGAVWLDRVLAAEPERPTIVMMHQPPFDTGIPYLDLYSCREGRRLSDVVARNGQVERVVCGHVHRFMQIRFGGTMLCTAPSTTTAIALQLRSEAKLCLPCRAASLPAASLAGGDRAHHAFHAGRHFPGALSFRLSASMGGERWRSWPW